jgi:hypothetical protein
MTDLGVVGTQAVNPNFALNNKFTFRIHKLPETIWKVKSFNLPGTQGNVATQNTSLNPIPRSGLQLDYDNLVVRFIVDEDWKNYIEIMNWMRLMAMPTSRDEYKAIALQDLKQPNTFAPDGGLVSDAVGMILSNVSNPNLVIFYRDIFPITLSGLDLQNDVEEPEPLVATVEFKYTWFDVEYVGDGPVGDA